MKPDAEPSLVGTPASSRSSAASRMYLRKSWAATPALAGFERPVLVVWDSEGKMMPNEEGRKLAAAFPDSRLVMLDDCRTLIPEDQPIALAAEIREFVG